jgi:hypothetical protein
MHFVGIDVILYIQLMRGLWIMRTSEVGLTLVPLIRMAWNFV